MPPKILYIAPAPPTIGGIPDYAARFRQALRAGKVAFDEIIPPETWPRRADVRRLRAAVRRKQQAGDYRRYQLVYLELGRHSDWEWHYARAFQDLTDLPTVILVHDPADLVERPFRYLGLENKPRWIRAFRRLLDLSWGRRQKRRLLRRAAQLVVLGPKGLADLERSWGQTAAIIPHVSYAAKPPHRTGRPVKILFFGFYAHNKGFDLLENAYRRLLAERPELTEQTSLIVNSTLFKGKDIDRGKFISEEELQELYATADISVLPYRASVPAGSSAILLRSLSAGIAIVCSDIPLFTQDVTPGKNALTFPEGDEAALAARLAELVTDGKMRVRLAKAAAATAVREHGPAVVGRKVAALLKEIK